jgi:tripartite ATP-independent transporter DctM subunit
VGRNPAAGPRGPRASRRERIGSLLQSLPIIIVILITIGGMYTGYFTPVEASSAGAFFTFVVAWLKGGLRPKDMITVVMQTMGATATIFLIIIAAFVFIPFMSLTEIPAKMIALVTAAPIGEIGILIAIVAVYIVLGMFLESIAMLVLTLPVVIPIAVALNWDLVWFGIIVVILLEMGLISPPVGVNVFVVKSLVPEVPMRRIFAGIWPFWFAMIAMIALLVLFPQLALWLPQTIVG